MAEICEKCTDGGCTDSITHFLSRITEIELCRTPLCHYLFIIHQRPHSLKIELEGKSKNIFSNWFAISLLPFCHFLALFWKVAAVRIWNILRQFAVSNLLFYNSEISSNFSTKFKLSSIETYFFDNAVFFHSFWLISYQSWFFNISTNPPWRTPQVHINNSFDVPLRSLLDIYFLMSWFDQTPAQSGRSFVPDKT